MQDITVRYKLVLHAAAVLSDGGALIFLGHSGAGKSTMCDLLSPYMPVLTDDWTYIVPRLHGGWYVTSSGSHFWTGVMPSPFNEVENEDYIPLRAIFRLYQATEPVLERTEPLLTCRHLMDAFFEISWQRQSPLEFKQYAFTNLAQMAQSVPGYAFYFDLSVRTAQALRGEMESRSID